MRKNAPCHVMVAYVCLPCMPAGSVNLARRACGRGTGWRRGSAAATPAAMARRLSATPRSPSSCTSCCWPARRRLTRKDAGEVPRYAPTCTHAHARVALGSRARWQSAAAIWLHSAWLQLACWLLMHMLAGLGSATLYRFACMHVWCPCLCLCLCCLQVGLAGGPAACTRVRLCHAAARKQRHAERRWRGQHAHAAHRAGRAQRSEQRLGPSAESA